MAKRPDFAQKLLDDLRMRKEKMGIASSSGRRSAQSSVVVAAASSSNAHGNRNSQRSLQGSRETGANNFSSNNMVSTEVTKIWLGTRHHKTPPYGASQDIIPFRGAAHVDHGVDVSMALALALSNSGKLQNIEFFTNATVGKERIMHHGSLHFGDRNGISMSDRPRHPTDQFPFFSHLQVGEVSKGVQQLNKILKACSNGLSFSGDSVDIGRELLKGAMDLEESLRMLVSLQEASDYMVGSQGKNVKLLKGKEDEESSSHKVNQKKLMNRPRFSFDRPKLHSHEDSREGRGADFRDQNKSALSYLEKSKSPMPNSSQGSSKASSKLISHRRSQSSGSGSKTDAQLSSVATKNSNSEELKSFKNENYSSSASKNIKQLGPRETPVGEKVRIPNVVAKLMGLEELPVPNAEVKNVEVPKSSNVIEMGKTSVKDSGNKKEVDAIKYSGTKSYQMDIQKKVLQEKDIMDPKATNNTEAVYSKGKRQPDNMENISSVSKHSPKPHIKLNNKQIDTTNMYHTKESKDSKKDGAERGETTNVQEQTSNAKVRQITHKADKPFLEQDTQHIASLPNTDHDDAVSKHELAQIKKDQLLEGKRNSRERFIVPGNQSNTSNDKVARQQSALTILKSKHAVHEIPTQKEHNARNKPQLTIEKKGDLKLKNTERSSYDMSIQKVLSGSSTIASKRSATNTTNKEQLKEYIKSSHHEKQQLRNGRSTYNELDRKPTDGSLGERKTFKTDPRTDKEKATPPLLETASRKPVHTLSAQKVDITKAKAQRNGSNIKLLEEPRRTETPPAERQHLKDQTSILQELERRWKERNGKAEGIIVSSHAMNPEQHLQQKTTSYSPLTDDCRKQRLADQRIATENIDHDTTITESASQQPPEISPKDHVEHQLILKENQPEGLPDRMPLCKTSRRQNEAISEVDEQGSLTKNEHLLKQIIINSQHFLNTAQALFKLKIPVGVLQASEDARPDEGSKLLLDCGYEIMRRKGNREEAIFAKRMSFAPAKVRCFDALIKELNGDLECLKISSKVESDDNSAAECLHKLLDREIQNGNPDVNCMWDFGWNITTFAGIEKDEVIRDVEKHVLNGLIYELARDLLNVSITT